VAGLVRNHWQVTAGALTTGKFYNDADEYVKTIDPKVILIDGRTLSELMIDFNLGVTTSGNYEIKKIDNDYFDEE